MSDDRDDEQPTEEPESGINDPLVRRDVEAPRAPFEAEPDAEE